jgi:hypothetical protein
MTAADEFAAMSGLAEMSERYELNMDAIAAEMIYGLADTPRIYWPGWLRIRASLRPWIASGGSAARMNT